jgi:hypothetical protein
MPPEWRPEKPVGESFRDKYKEVLNEPVPDKLKKLIEALKELEKNESKAPDSD